MDSASNSGCKKTPRYAATKTCFYDWPSTKQRAGLWLIKKVSRRAYRSRNVSYLDRLMMFWMLRLLY